MLSLENDFRSFRRYPWINDCNAGGVLVNSWRVSADNYLSRLPPIEKSDAMLVIAAGGTVLLNSRHDRLLAADLGLAVFGMFYVFA